MLQEEVALQEYVLLMLLCTKHVEETAEDLAVGMPLITTVVEGEMGDVPPYMPMIGDNKARLELWVPSD